MNSNPTFSSVNISIVLDRLKKLGYSTEGILRSQAALMSPDFGSDESRLTRSELENFWISVEELTGDPNIGLRLADNYQPSGKSIVSHLLMSSSNLLQGLQRLLHYHEIIGESITLDVREDEHFLTISYNEMKALRRTQAEYFALHMVRLASWLTGVEVIPCQVHFAHQKPSDHTEHERLFQCPVSFSCTKNMIQFPQEIARLTSPHANEQLATAFEELAAKYILNLRNQGFVKDVIAEIDKQLVQGSICIGSVADGLGLSTRSLKRTLEAENTTFSDILDEFRRNKAENLLSTSVYSITDIGYLCGYNESSSFVRAFRRWNGMSPRQYRGQAQQ